MPKRTKPAGATPTEPLVEGDGEHGDAPIVLDGDGASLNLPPTEPRGVEPTEEAYFEPVQKRTQKSTGATGGSSSAATTEKPNAATAAAGAAEAAPAVAGDGAAPEGAGADVGVRTLFGDVLNVTNKLESRPGKWVSPEEYEANHGCTAPWVFAIMPSCITDHRNCALPPSTALYHDAIGNGALSGRFVLLADDPCSYVTSKKQMEEHVLKFLKPAMASVSEPGKYLDTSLTIIAHGNKEDGEVKIGDWWVTPLMLAYWLRRWLGDAGPSLKHIHLDSCSGLTSIRAEVQRARHHTPSAAVHATSHFITLPCTCALVLSDRAFPRAQPQPSEIQDVQAGCQCRVHQLRY